MKTKHLLLLLLSTPFVFLSSCKKDGDSGPPGATPPYTINAAAPACHPIAIDMTITGVSTAHLTGTLAYDNNRRVIKSVTTGGDGNTQHFYYSGNLLIIVKVMATEEEYDTLHLNANGLVEFATHSSKNQAGQRMEYYYYYDNLGFLTLQLNKPGGTSFSSGIRVTNDGSNRTSMWNLQLDHDGRVLDSLLLETYTYYPELGGVYTEMDTYLTRQGRPNRNLTKTRTGSGSAVTTSYYEFNSKKLVSRLTEESGSSTLTGTIEWECN